MQEEKYTDFDLSVRTILSDERERVPLRVGAVVLHRLWWQRATTGALAFAAACCALAAILFLHPAVVKTPESGISLKVDCVSDPRLCQAQIPSPRHIPASRSFQSPVMEESVITASVPAVTEPGGGSVCTDADPEVVALQWADAMEQKETRKKTSSKPAVYASGAFGANDSKFYGTVLQPSYAKGERPEAYQENSVSTYDIPLSAGIGVVYPVSERLYIGTGVNWTLLSRSFEGAYKTESGTMTHRMHYVGIPLNVYWSVLESDKWTFYVYGGTQAEKCVSNKYYFLSCSPSALYKTEVKPLQWSVAAGIGVEYMINDRMALYFDPCARYFFDCGQPVCLRTEKPLNIGLEAGMRFSL